MDNETGIEQIVYKKLKEYKINDLSTKPKLKEQLKQLESYIQSVISKQKDIVTETKKWNKVNLLSVSMGANISRATIYNNPNTLYEYIKNRLEEIEKEDILGVKRFEKLYSDYEGLKVIVEGLKESVVENYLLQQQIEVLKTELKNTNSVNESLTKKVRKAKAEIEQLHLKLKNNSNVISISKD